MTEETIVWTEKTVPIDELKPYEKNPRIITHDAFERLKDSIKKLGFHQRMLCQPDGKVIGGHQRLRAMKELGATEIKILIPSRELTTEEFRQLLIQDNLPFGQHDFDMLANDFTVDELTDWGMPESWLLGKTETEKETPKEEKPPSVSLAEKFGIPPFSVLNAREGWWQARKASWLARGIKSELGRGANTRDFSTTLANVPESEREEWNKARRLGTTYGTAGNISDATGTSVFDPVLCEIAYRWFSPFGGAILDPFAGGSVRGIVAAVLGRKYTGVDLRLEQVAANFENSKELGLQGGPNEPYWIQGDSRTVFGQKSGHDELMIEADLIFSCPPYADLEVYSDDPRDLSTMEYAHFIKAYREIIAGACSKLKHDRFAIFVVGEVRAKNGAYVNLVGETVQAFIDAGLHFYNEAILVTAAGSLPMRVNKQFTNSRKLGKTHQNVLIFVKGDPKKAVAAIGDVEFGELESNNLPA